MQTYSILQTDRHNGKNYRRALDAKGHAYRKAVTLIRENVRFTVLIAMSADKCCKKGFILVKYRNGHCHADITEFFFYSIGNFLGYGGRTRSKICAKTSDSEDLKVQIIFEH